MKTNYNIPAQKREKTKHSARETRSQSRIPASLYGYETECMSISVDASEFLKLFRKTGKSALIEVDVEGSKKIVLVQDYSVHPVKDGFTHIDFLAIDLKKPTVVQVPLVFKGESPAVKNLGGIFITSHSELSIRCLPTEIPHEIEASIDSLQNIGDSLTIKDLGINPNYEILNLEPESIICSIVSHTEEVVESTSDDPEEQEGEASNDEAPKEEGKKEEAGD